MRDSQTYKSTPCTIPSFETSNFITKKKSSAQILLKSRHILYMSFNKLEYTHFCICFFFRIRPTDDALNKIFQSDRRQRVR